jgi:hypothetical protein
MDVRGIVILSPSLYCNFVCGTVNRARQLHRGDKNVAALDRN